LYEIASKPVSARVFNLPVNFLKQSSYWNVHSNISNTKTTRTQQNSKVNFLDILNIALFNTKQNETRLISDCFFVPEMVSYFPSLCKRSPRPSLTQGTGFNQHALCQRTNPGTRPLLIENYLEAFRAGKVKLEKFFK